MPDGSLRYYVKDHLGSTRTVMTQTWNQPTEATDYLTYGAQNELVTPTADQQAREKFTGKECDVEGSDPTLGLAGINLLYFGARYYDAEVGIFTSTDPAGQFWNSYSYCGGDPVNGTDPDGTWDDDPTPPLIVFGDPTWDPIDEPPSIPIQLQSTFPAEVAQAWNSALNTVGDIAQQMTPILPLSPPPGENIMVITPFRAIDALHPAPGHSGLDLVYGKNWKIAPGLIANAPIYASLGGTVERAGTQDAGGYGRWIVIKTRNYYTVYGHVNESVKVGNTVACGQIIGTVAPGKLGYSTGPHLHWQVNLNAIPLNGTPIDPLSLFH